MNLQEKVIDIISKQLKISSEKINLESQFMKDLKTDSLDIVELIMILEEKFHLQIPDDQVEKMNTVGQVVSYIEENKNDNTVS